MGYNLKTFYSLKMLLASVLHRARDQTRTIIDVTDGFQLWQLVLKYHLMEEARENTLTVLFKISTLLH